MTDPDSEIVVIGGGPCGSFSAMIAAELGRNVIVLEEHERIGIPDHCAGHISIQGLRRLSVVPPSTIVQNKIDKARFYSPSGHSLTIECSRPQSYVLNRALFDQYLADCAENKGARFLTGCRAEQFVEKSGVVRGVKTSSGRIEAKVVINAEGSNGSLLRRSGKPLPNRSDIIVGAQTEVERVEDVDPNCVELYLGNEYSPQFYAWIIPLNDGRAKVGLGTGEGNPRALLERFIQFHPIASKKIKGASGVYSFHPIPLGGSLRRTYYGGLLLVGDVASQVKPTTGGGVVFGMMCARHAGKVAADAVTSHDSSDDFLSTYQRLWSRELSRDICLARLVRRYFACLNDRTIDRIFRIGESLDVGSCFRDIADIDFVTKIALDAVRRPRALATLLGALIVSILR